MARPMHYGFRLVDGEVVALGDDQDVVALVRCRVAEGASLRTVAAELEKLGFRPRVGDHWHPETIRRMAAQAPVSAGKPKPKV